MIRLLIAMLFCCACALLSVGIGLLMHIPMTAPDGEIDLTDSAVLGYCVGVVIVYLTDRRVIGRD